MKDFNNTLLSSTIGQALETSMKTVKEIAEKGGIKAKNPINEMNSLFPVWSTEIIESTENEKQVAYTVAVYIPGMVKTGRSVLKINQYTKPKDYDGLYTKAIYNAIAQLGIELLKEDTETDDSKKQEVEIKSTKSSVTIPTQEQVVTPVVEIIPHIEAEISLDQFDPSVMAGLQQQYIPVESRPIVQAQPTYQAPMAPQPAPQQQAPAPTKTNNFRPDQIGFVKNMKLTNNITNDEMLLRTFKGWNNALQSVQEIYEMQEAQLDAFIIWYTNAGPLMV